MQVNSKVLIAGGTGLIGQRLSILLEAHNYSVCHLSRKANPTARFPAYQWDLINQTIDIKAIEDADYIINLAGAGIADRLWTKSRKKMIIESRVKSNELLFNTLTANNLKPKAFIGASAIGYYGNSGDLMVDEKSGPGNDGFLSESVRIWEKSLDQKVDFRQVNIRIGIVMSTKGGAMEKIMLPFKFGMASYLGNGSQYYSWIHIDDLCNIFKMAIEKPIAGIYNGVSPNPSTNLEITKTIKKVTDSMAILMPTPGFALKMAMGEMATMVLNSTKVSSKKIEQEGFQFKFPLIESAISDLINRKI